MSSAMVMERTGMGISGVGVPGVGAPGLGAPAGAQVGANWLMVPRCNLKLEKCQGGLKINCTCDDKMAASMVQNLCQMLQSGLCSCCVMMNGMTVCCCNLTMGICRIEQTDQGVSISCTSGDQQCCQMIQACCDCICCMLDSGCTCCVMLNNTPVCCGQSETSRQQQGGKQQQQQPAKAGR